MKKIILLLAIVFSLSACSKSDDPTPTPTTPGNYTGISTVTDASATESPFVNSNAVYNITLNSDNTLNILLVESQFSTKMPKLDMQFKNIPYTINSNGEYTFYSSSFIPQISDVPYPRFEITNLKGKIVEKKITVEFTCMAIYNVAYIGTKINL